VVPTYHKDVLFDDIKGDCDNRPASIPSTSPALERVNSSQLKSGPFRTLEFLYRNPNLRPQVLKARRRGNQGEERVVELALNDEMASQ
jgi:hypothetical protein